MSAAERDPTSVSHRADPRYQRLMEATRVAARRGYDEVSMRELAETCRLSMTTIYQFCRSKDQLIAEAHVENMERFRERLASRPPSGATPHERVRQVMWTFTRALDVDEPLSRTLMRALYSLDPHVIESRASTGAEYASIIDAAIGEVEIRDRQAVINTLGHVIDSVILGWLTRRHDLAWARSHLDDAVDALLGGTDTSAS